MPLRLVLRFLLLLIATTATATATTTATPRSGGEATQCTRWSRSCSAGKGAPPRRSCASAGSRTSSPKWSRSTYPGTPGEVAEPPPLPPPPVPPRRKSRSRARRLLLRTHRVNREWWLGSIRGCGSCGRIGSTFRFRFRANFFLAPLLLSPLAA